MSQSDFGRDVRDRLDRARSHPVAPPQDAPPTTCPSALTATAEVLAKALYEAGPLPDVPTWEIAVSTARQWRSSAAAYTVATARRTAQRQAEALRNADLLAESATPSLAHQETQAPRPPVVHLDAPCSACGQTREQCRARGAWDPCCHACDTSAHRTHERP